MNCSVCKERDCYKTGKDCTGRQEEIFKQYKDDHYIRKMMEGAAALESEGYMLLTRVEEIAQFAKKMGYTHLGIAFCIGLHGEAATLQKLFKDFFTISSVCCKVCGIDKNQFGLKKLREISVETMCNPAGQAAILNSTGTDLNIMLGLCVGHDMIFTKKSAAPVTTLVVKDRVLANNPAGALYSPYWKKIIRDKMSI